MLIDALWLVFNLLAKMLSYVFLMYVIRSVIAIIDMTHINKEYYNGKASNDTTSA